jgi:hypothetical protein
VKTTTTWLRAEWDRVAGVGLIALGGVLLILGWVGVSDSAYVAEQVAYVVSGGVGALFCLGLGVGLLLSADMHDEWRKLDRIEAVLRGQPLPDVSDLLAEFSAIGADAPAVPGPSPARAPAPALAKGLVLDWRGDGLRRGMVVTGAAAVLALGVLGLGWYESSGTWSLDRAVTGLAVGAAAVVLVATAVGVYLFRLRSGLAGRRRRLVGVAQRAVGGSRGNG